MFVKERMSVVNVIVSHREAHSLLSSKAVPGTIPQTDPANFTFNAKQPVSANCVEVLASAANECVWCQHSVLCPSSPSVRRIHKDESQKELKAVNTCQLVGPLETHDCLNPST